jgi:hypothetical protein
VYAYNGISYTYRANGKNAGIVSIVLLKIYKIFIAQMRKCNRRIKEKHDMEYKRAGPWAAAIIMLGIYRLWNMGVWDQLRSELSQFVQEEDNFKMGKSAAGSL